MDLSENKQNHLKFNLNNHLYDQFFQQKNNGSLRFF